MAKITVNGRPFWQALGYAFEACPTGDDASRLAQVVFIDRRVVCSDSKRWHVGLLPDDVAFPRPLVVARESIAELLRRIELADYLARSHGGGFFVHINTDNCRVELQFADEDMAQKLIEVKVGHVPDKWTPPVPDDAPTLGAQAVESGHIIAAAKWWQSWQKDHVTVTTHGFGPGKPVRFDVHNRGELVGQAYVLPSSRGAAQLPPNEPLLEGITAGELRGQSILDLSLELPPPRLPAAIAGDGQTEGYTEAIRGKGRKPKIQIAADAYDDEPPKAKTKKGKKPKA